MILTDSDIESLLACAMASEQQQIAAAEPSVLLPAWWGGIEEIDLILSAVDPAIVRQAGVHGLDVFPDHAVYPPEEFEPRSDAERGLLQSRMLLEGAHLAMRAGIRRVVWPVRVASPDRAQQVQDLVDEIAAAIDRALLASRLASLDASPETAVEVVIETPFVDLSNAQIAELARDMALPLETCWWHDARSLPGAVRAREFWSSAIARSGVMTEPKPEQRTHA